MWGVTWVLSCLLAYGFLPTILSKTLPQGAPTRDMVEGAAMKIAAFNVQIFGSRKMKNQMVKDVLVKVILRYDIILIQEIRSTDDGPINKLLKSVNRLSSPPGVYNMALSERLGRTHSKEQYAFLYRTDSVSLQDSYVFDDGDERTKKDKFQREPFIVRFRGHHSYTSEFAMAAIHTMPSEAVLEIDRMVDVYDDIVQRWKLENVIILGDFNSGCSYVTKSKWPMIRLATDRRFYWLFSDDVDTTVAKSDCPYDRMVVAGYDMIRGIFADSAKVFHYDKAYGLTQDEAEDVSDHWPIEIQLKDYTFKDVEKYFSESITVRNRNNHMAKVSSKRVLYSLRSAKNPLFLEGFTSTTTYTKSGKIDTIVIEKSVGDADAARDVIDVIHKHYPNLVSGSQVAVSRREMDRIKFYQEVDCSGEESEDIVYQMLSNKCSGMKLPEINGVQLVCSTSSLSCEIGITASLSTFSL